jgi:hypothetical protein
VFTFTQPIKVPENLQEGKSLKSDFPMQLTIAILSSIPMIEFDMLIIYDEG